MAYKLHGMPVSDHVYALNAASLPPDATPRAESDEMGVSGASTLERRFVSIWRVFGGPELETEYKFHPTRKWRLDFYHAPTQTGIEIEGGTWSGGRHVRGKGYANDCEKYNAAAMQGIRVLRLTSEHVNHDYVRGIIRWLEGVNNE